MRLFDQKLLRLKGATGVTEDQAVASLLGMSKAAFSERKRRDAFPDDRVYALAARHPEWHLDVDHILTGASDARRELQKRLDAIRVATQKTAALALPPPYTHVLQELFFFIEIEDAEGVLNAIRNLAAIPMRDTPNSAGQDLKGAAPSATKVKKKRT